VCECDGFEWHGDRLRWKRDRRRIAAIEAAGWRVVHVTWEDVTRYPVETLDRLALALRETP
jgi:very-short-patch-repair endonuclease